MEVKQFNKNFERLKHKQIVLYGLGINTEYIIKNYKDYNIIAVTARDRDIVKKKYFSKPIINLKNIKKDCIIIICANETNSQIIYDEIKYLLKNKIEIFFLNGSKNIIKNLPNVVKYYKLNSTALKKTIKNHDIISFDLYDTVIFREIDKPKNVLELIEHDSKKENFKSQLSLRKKIQDKLYLRNNNFKFSEIYKKWSNKLNVDIELINNFKKNELFYEFLTTKNNELLLDILKYTKNINKTVILTTDIYLDKKFIVKLLKKLKILKYFDHIFVSSDLSKSKKDQKMFNFLKKKFLSKTLLHIGDNYNEDFMNAKKNNIKAIHFISPDQIMNILNLNFLYNQCKTPTDYLSLGLVKNKFYYNFNNKNNIKNNIFVFKSNEDFGYIFFGSLLFNFIIFLAKYLKKNNFKKVYFCARDGYLLIRLYNIISKKFKLPQAYYLKTSRNLVDLSTIENISDIKETFNRHRYFGTFNDLLMSRFAIKAKKNDQNKYKNINSISDMNKILNYLEKYLPEIYSKSKKNHNNYIKYLNSIDIKDNKKICIVDMGFNGTIQKGLMKLSKKSNFFGCYLCSNNKKEFVNGKLLKTNGFYEYNKSNFFDNSYLFESIFTAPYGTFTECLGKNQFTHSEIFKNQKYFKNKIKVFKGIENFFNDISKYIKALESLEISPNLSDSLYGLITKKNFIFENLIMNHLYLDNKYVRNKQNKIII